MHRWLLLLCFTLWTGSLMAQVAPRSYLDRLPPLLDRELFFGEPEISGARLSPDGRYLTFLKPYRGVRNIWIKGIDEPFEAARPLTADERPVPGYFWSEDSRYVLYVQDKGGNEDFHLYAVDPTTEPDPATGVPPARNLTPYENTRAIILATPEVTPRQILVGLNDRDPRWHDVYRLDLDTGERTLLLKNEAELAGFEFDLEGRLRLALRVTEDGGSEILRVDGEHLTPVYRCSVEETCTTVRFHRNGRQVYLITNRGEHDKTALVLFDPETGQETLVERDPEGQVDFGGAIFSDQTEELVATYYVGDRMRVYPKDATFAQDLEFLRTQLPEGELYFGSATEDERLVLVTVQRDVDPGAVYLYDRQQRKVQLLYRSRPELPVEHLAPMQAVHYRARDGAEIPAYLTLPKNVEPKGLAAVVLVHGGPWARDFWGYDPYAQFLANRGYAVLQPNFRGSEGYGKAFLNAGNKQWGTGVMQHDVTDGVRYLIESGIADSQGIAIMGGSYGGYATLAGLTFTPELYAAGVSIVGPANLITLLKTIPPYWASARRIFDTRVGNPDDPTDRLRLIAQSPFYHAHRIRAPLLVIQGANDPRVKKTESDQIVVAARENGVSVAYMVAPDEGHGFRGEMNRLAMIAAIERFLAQHLGGRFQATMSAELEAHLRSLMVDPATVTLPDTLALQQAQRGALPPAQGTWLRPVTLHYETTLSVQGQTFTLRSERRLELGRLDGQAVWQLVDRVRMPMGETTDTVWVDQATLRPLRRHAQGMGTLWLTYEDGHVSGRLQSPMGTMNIEKELQAPVVGDGGAFDVYLAGLPLREGYEATLRVFDPQQQEVRPMKLTVTGTQTVAIPAGTFTAYVVRLEALDDGSGSGLLYVNQEAPHHVLQAEMQLPAQMGGGTAKTRLLAME